jgi:hypothetical protein
MRVLKKRATDVCSSLEAFRVELGPDGTAVKVVISPAFQRSLPSPHQLIFIKNVPLLQSLVNSLPSSKGAINAAVASYRGLTHIHPI